MAGSELDAKNLSCAQQNINANNLQHRIRLVPATAGGMPPLIPLDALGIERADFVMCNPPFYESREEMAAAQAAKNMPPSAICTGANIEMVCEGGDLGFVMRMVEESKALQHRVRWFSCMLGKWSSAEAIATRLKELGVDNLAVRSLMGFRRKTQRWAVAWSYGDMRPRAVSYSCYGPTWF
jgi:23S rRNA (adenine1618-N6)-methyltransferase